MSSFPVVHLPLTFAWGLQGAWHRDGPLAVLFPLWLERLETARGCSIPVRKAQVASPREWALVSSPCWKQIDNCHGISAAWPYFPNVLKRFHLRDKLIIVVEFALLSKAHSICIQIIAVAREFCRYCLIWFDHQSCCCWFVADVALGLQLSRCTL